MIGKGVNRIAQKKSGSRGGCHSFFVLRGYLRAVR